MSSLTEAWGEDGLFLKKIIKLVLPIFCWLKLFYEYSVNSIFLSFIRTGVVTCAFKKVFDAHSCTNTDNFLLICDSVSASNNYLNETEIPHIRKHPSVFTQHSESNSMRLYNCASQLRIGLMCVVNLPAVVNSGLHLFADHVLQTTVTGPAARCHRNFPPFSLGPSLLVKVCVNRKYGKTSPP